MSPNSPIGIWIEIISDVVTLGGMDTFKAFNLPGAAGWISQEEHVTLGSQGLEFEPHAGFRDDLNRKIRMNPVVWDLNWRFQCINMFLIYDSVYKSKYKCVYTMHVYIPTFLK